jgi:hypothetical protein
MPAFRDSRFAEARPRTIYSGHSLEWNSKAPQLPERFPKWEAWETLIEGLADDRSLVSEPPGTRGNSRLGGRYLSKQFEAVESAAVARLTGEEGIFVTNPPIEPERLLSKLALLFEHRDLVDAWQNARPIGNGPILVCRLSVLVNAGLRNLIVSAVTPRLGARVPFPPLPSR